MKRILHCVSFALIVPFSLFCLSLSAHAQSLNEVQRDEVRDLVREYILENPEIITEAINLLEERERLAEENARANAMANMRDRIFDSERQIVLGNPDGDVTLVEFFDYNCGFCKRAHHDMIALLESDSNLRVVLKEFPVLGQGSVEAARVSIAVNALAPEKFEEFHLQTMLGPGQANEAKAMRVATSLGIDEDALLASLESNSGAETIQEVYQIADALGLTGTPSYVVGNQVVFGAVGVDALREAIANARDENG